MFAVVFLSSHSVCVFLTFLIFCSHKPPPSSSVPPLPLFPCHILYVHHPATTLFPLYIFITSAFVLLKKPLQGNSQRNNNTITLTFIMFHTLWLHTDANLFFSVCLVVCVFVAVWVCAHTCDFRKAYVLHSGRPLPIFPEIEHRTFITTHQGQNREKNQKYSQKFSNRGKLSHYLVQVKLLNCWISHNATPTWRILSKPLKPRGEEEWGGFWRSLERGNPSVSYKYVFLSSSAWRMNVIPPHVTQSCSTSSETYVA